MLHRFHACRWNPWNFRISLLFLLVLREVIIIIIIIRGIGREKKERKKGKGKEKGEKKKEKKRKKDNEDSRVGNKIVTSSKELFPCVSHGLRRVS